MAEPLTIEPEGALAPLPVTFSYCYRTGIIGFGRHVPEGAFSLLHGDDETVRDIVSIHARHAHDGHTLLVPGVPEADTDDDARDAAIAFYRRLLMALERRMS